MLTKKKFQSIVYIKIFFLILFIAAFLSISYRAFLLIKNRAFKFETFNVLMQDKDVRLISVNTQEKKMVIFKFMGAGNLFSDKSLFSTSTVLGVPIDGMISAKNSFEFNNLEKDFLETGRLFSMIFVPNKYSFRKINIFDLTKLFVISKFIPEQDRKTKTLNNLSADFRRNEEIDLELEGLFKDSEIFNKKISLEIINATDIDGLGSRVALILKNLGYNVISVSNGGGDKSKILIKDGVSSVERIEKIFGITAEKKETHGIADVVLILGKDMVKN